MKRLWFRFAGWALWWWTLSDRFKTLTEAYRGQGERLRGTEDALKRVADSIERDLANADTPGLTSAEVERLAVLAEECGELIQMVGKVLRHGWAGASPFNGKPNQVQVEREAGDVLAAIDALIHSGDLRRQEVRAWRGKKAFVGQKWMHHQ